MFVSEGREGLVEEKGWDCFVTQLIVVAAWKPAGKRRKTRRRGRDAASKTPEGNSCTDDEVIEKKYSHFLGEQAAG